MTNSNKNNNNGWLVEYRYGYMYGYMQFYNENIRFQ